MQNQTITSVSASAIVTVQLGNGVPCSFAPLEVRQPETQVTEEVKEEIVEQRKETQVSATPELTLMDRTLALGNHALTEDEKTAVRKVLTRRAGEKNNVWLSEEEFQQIFKFKIIGGIPVGRILLMGHDFVSIWANTNLLKAQREWEEDAREGVHNDSIVGSLKSFRRGNHNQTIMTIHEGEGLWAITIFKPA